GELQAVGQRLHRQRLGQPRNALEQHVPAGDEADEQPLDHLPLADDHLPGLRQQRIDEGGFLLDAVVEEPDVGRWLCGHGWVVLRKGPEANRKTAGPSEASRPSRAAQNLSRKKAAVKPAKAAPPMAMAVEAVFQRLAFPWRDSTSDGLRAPIPLVRLFE